MNLALLTDLYQLTMAYGYWREELHEREACFHLFFRTPPFHSGFTVACGLADALEYLRDLHFAPDDIEYLGTLTGSDGKPLFAREFLEFLAQWRFRCDVDGVPEGTVVFPNQPLLRVSGPILDAQLVETTLLNILNFQTLVATKAARICLAAGGEPVLEFGARRAQGCDGALSASRAAYVGGCSATSNVLAGKQFRIPVRGTHAHSWVMLFDSEIEAFEAYARALPSNVTFLVDTYDTLEGVRHAVEVGRRLRTQGHDLLGVRLDSGDLAQLSIEARRILDEAGFKKTAIVASNDLDETIIASLKAQGAQISIWGVGTRLVTGHDQPALGGVYKLSATRENGGAWQPRIKVSEQTIKISNPGVLSTRRFYDADGMALCDAIHDVATDVASGCTIVDSLDPTRRRRVSAAHDSEELLVPLVRGGKVTYAVPPLAESHARTGEQLARFSGGVKRFVNPHLYPVGLEEHLHEQKTQLILRARNLE